MKPFHLLLTIIYLPVSLCTLYTFRMVYRPLPRDMTAHVTTAQ
jgi:hypothetical protein